jgi:hypothetical protein
MHLTLVDAGSFSAHVDEATGSYLVAESIYADQIVHSMNR